MVVLTSNFNCSLTHTQRYQLDSLIMTFLSDKNNVSENQIGISKV